jgi:hypothetical protein
MVIIMDTGTPTGDIKYSTHQKILCTGTGDSIFKPDTGTGEAQFFEILNMKTTSKNPMIPQYLYFLIPVSAVQ